MLDLALGFIIGTAFAALVQSLAENVLMQMVAAVAGQPDYAGLTISIGTAKIHYGAFVTDLLNFLILTAVLFFVVKMISWLGIAKGRVFGRRDCPWCEEEVPSEALVCKFCRQPLVEKLPTLAQATARLDAREARRIPGLLARRRPPTSARGDQPPDDDPPIAAPLTPVDR